MTEKKTGRSPGVFDQAFLTGTDLEVTEVILIRHAQQDVDFDKASLAEAMDPPLSDHGRQQARLLGEAMSTLNLDAVFVSPLRRAMETAEAITKHHRLEVRPIDDLKEVGVFQDVPADMRPADYLGEELLQAVRLRMLNERSWDVYPHSEPSAHFKNRAVNAVESAIAAEAGERIAIVCHGGIINAYIGHIIGTAYDMFFRPAHTSVNVVVAGGGRRVLRLLNDTHHLRTGEGDFLTY